MSKLEKIAAIAVVGLMVSGTAVAQEISKPGSYELKSVKQQMPELGKAVGSIDKWEIMDNSTIFPIYRDELYMESKRYVQFRSHSNFDGKGVYFAWYLVCNKTVSKKPFYVNRFFTKNKLDIDIFIDSKPTDGTTELIGATYGNERSSGTISWEWPDELKWETYIPECPKYIS